MFADVSRPSRFPAAACLEMRDVELGHPAVQGRVSPASLASGTVAAIGTESKPGGRGYSKKRLRWSRRDGL